MFVKWRKKHIIKLHGLAVWSQAQTTPVMHKSIARKANWATFNKHKTGRGYLIINSWSKKIQDEDWCKATFKRYAYKKHSLSHTQKKSTATLLHFHGEEGAHLVSEYHPRKQILCCITSRMGFQKPRNTRGGKITYLALFIYPNDVRFSMLIITHPQTLERKKRSRIP